MNDARELIEKHVPTGLKRPLFLSFIHIHNNKYEYIQQENIFHSEGEKIQPSSTPYRPLQHSQCAS